jgi:spore germination protein KB
MAFDRNKFNARELFFSAAAFVQGSSLLTSFLVGALRQNSWLGVLAAYLLSLPMLALYLFLLSRRRIWGWCS